MRFQNGRGMIRAQRSLEQHPNRREQEDPGASLTIVSNPERV